MNKVVYVMVRKVREEVRRVHGVVRGAYIKWSGRSVRSIRWSGGCMCCEQVGVCGGQEGV